MAVTQFDPATGEALEKWETREEVTLPVAPLLEEKTYLPQENATFDGLTLESVHGERYATGVYQMCIRDSLCCSLRREYPL